MSETAPRFPNSTGQVKDSQNGDEEMRRTRMMALRAKQQRCNSFSSLSSVSENDMPKCGYVRRGSAPEWDTINRVLLARRSSQRQFHTDWVYSSLDIDQLQPYDMARHLISGMSSRRQSLPTGELRWGESTTTMEATTSLSATLNGPRRKFKIILLGDGGVGKSSFLQTLLNGKYSEPTTTTNMVTANAVRTVMHNGQEVELNFFDTAGQEKYRSMTASYYRHAHGCLLFFNVNYRQTFSHLEYWLDDLTKFGNRDNMAVLLVGLTHKHKTRHQQENREYSNENTQSHSSVRSWSDHDRGTHDSNKRAVSRAEVEHFASNCYIPYMEADVRRDPDAVLSTLDKLLDLLLFRDVQDDDASRNEFIKPGSQKRRTECCS